MNYYSSIRVNSFSYHLDQAFQTTEKFKGFFLCLKDLFGSEIKDVSISVHK